MTDEEKVKSATKTVNRAVAMFCKWQDGEGLGSIGGRNMAYELYTDLCSLKYMLEKEPQE